MSKRNIIFLSSFLIFIILVVVFYFYFYKKNPAVTIIINPTPEQKMVTNLINYKPNPNDPVSSDQINKELNSIKTSTGGNNSSNTEMLNSLNQVNP